MSGQEWCHRCGDNIWAGLMAYTAVLVSVEYREMGNLEKVPRAHFIRLHAQNHDRNHQIDKSGTNYRPREFTSHHLQILDSPRSNRPVAPAL